MFVGAVALFGELLNEIFNTSSFDDDVFQVLPPYLLDSGARSYTDTILRSLPSLGATVVFLLLARFLFVRRAFAPPQQRLRVLFRWLDAVMQRSNRLIGGFAFRSPDRALPEDDPIAWRELTRTTLGRRHYLVRLLLALEILTVGLCVWAVHEDGGGSNEALSSIAAILGTLAVLALSVFAANAFVSERVNQTLEVLMTTPLSAREIVRQKARMLTRFMWVLAVPLLTVFFIEWWTEVYWSWRNPNWHSSALYLLCSFLTLAIYLPLILWLSLWIGLQMKTRFRAIVTALAVIVAWCVAPIIVAMIFRQEPPSLLLLASPLVVPVFNEMASLHQVFAGPPLPAVLINFLLYATVLGGIRHRCLAESERYLRGQRTTKGVEPAKYDY